MIKKIKKMDRYWSPLWWVRTFWPFALLVWYAATTNDICPVCRTGQLRLKTGTYETVFNDGEEEKSLKVPDMRWLDCEHCGEVVLDDNAMDRIDQAKYRIL